ncbi:MAG: glycosyltransferase [Pseudomonadota bacterium]
MISVIFPTFNAAETLPRALSPLVSGVAAGVVKEAIVADGGSDDETAIVAEAAGCALVRASHNRAAQLSAGAKAARGDWLLILEPDTVLCEG